MAETLKERPVCTHRILKEFAQNGMMPADEEIADRIAGIVDRPHATACGVGKCMLAGADMMAVMEPNDQSNERLAAVAESALPDCGFGTAADEIITTRMTFNNLMQEPGA